MECDHRVVPIEALDELRPFPHSRLTAITALAQHHGIPTRLLDWTWKPMVAVYFAASAVARRRGPGEVPPNDAPFSVFALRREVMVACKGLDPEIFIITVPTATNSRLHVQGGQFTLVQPISIDEHPLPTIEVVLERHVDRIAERVVDDGPKLEKRFPLLVEYRVPSREARTTMALLALSGVTAASAFPSLDGVVTALLDERFHQYARPGSRS